MGTLGLIIMIQYANSLVVMNSVPSWKIIHRLITVQNLLFHYFFKNIALLRCILLFIQPKGFKVGMIFKILPLFIRIIWSKCPRFATGTVLRFTSNPLDIFWEGCLWFAVWRSYLYYRFEENLRGWGVVVGVWSRVQERGLFIVGSKRHFPHYEELL